MCVDCTYPHRYTHLKILGYVLGYLTQQDRIYSGIKAKSVNVV